VVIHLKKDVVIQIKAINKNIFENKKIFQNFILNLNLQTFNILINNLYKFIFDYNFCFLSNYR